MQQSEYKKPESDVPFFSVIITTYNRATLLKRALDSLIAQTENDWEAIIVDDGSTDGTEFQIAPYKKQYKRIKYFRQENRGATVSKNLGIRLSEGKFITFLDSDDEYDPHHLEIRKKILIENNSVEFLHGGAKIIGNHYVPDRFDYKKQIHLSYCVIGATFFISRRLCDLMKEFKDIPLGSDADFFEKVNKAGGIIMEIKTPTYIYHRETMNSITNNLMRNTDEPASVTKEE